MEAVDREAPCDTCQENAAKLTRHEMVLLPPEVRAEVKALRALRYGSLNPFWASPDDDDDAPSDLREQIDRARAEEKRASAIERAIAPKHYPPNAWHG